MFLASNKDVSAPAGCVNERLNSDHPKELVHEELSASLVADDDGKPIPFQLQVHLDKLKRQYLSFIRHMQVRERQVSTKSFSHIRINSILKGLASSNPTI